MQAAFVVRPGVRRIIVIGGSAARTGKPADIPLISAKTDHLWRRDFKSAAFDRRNRDDRAALGRKRIRPRWRLIIRFNQ
jgi:hypothetical protein